jgi:hypothetical protein
MGATIFSDKRQKFPKTPTNQFVGNLVVGNLTLDKLVWKLDMWPIPAYQA